VRDGTKPAREGIRMKLQNSERAFISGSRWHCDS
jgi:hypothetical protein